MVWQGPCAGAGAGAGASGQVQPAQVQWSDAAAAWGSRHASQPASQPARRRALPAFMAVALTALFAMPSRISSTQSRSLATATSRASATMMPRPGSWMTCGGEEQVGRQARSLDLGGAQHDRC